MAPYSPTRFIAAFLLVIACFSSSTAAPDSAEKRSLIRLVCGPDNDLWIACRNSRIRVERHDTAAEAVQAATPRSAVLFLADHYPAQTVVVPNEVWSQAAKRELRLFIEFPATLPGTLIGAPVRPTWERLIISSDTLAPDLPRGCILMAHDFHIQSVVAPDPLIVAARVAGYDSAVYGIPSTARPVLFTLDNGRVLAATTRLSSFVAGRYAPRQEWTALWSWILERLTGTRDFKLDWQPLVTASYGPQARLPANYERAAFRAAVNWHFDSQLLISPERWPEVQRVLLSGGELVSPSPAGASRGDGQFGILEGYTSQIRHDGSQLQRAPVRADCQAESAMVLALASVVIRDLRAYGVSRSLLSFLYGRSDLCRGARANPQHPAYGLIAWGSTAPAWTVANYGDDNARVMLATMLAAACIKYDDCDEPLLRALYANLRTTGKFGFRGDRIDLGPLEKHGWRHYEQAATVNYSPHFESYNWACFLWAYANTGDREFLDKTRIGIRMMMEAYPDRWRWNDNMERARMLLCLAWLTRIDDSPEPRRWLTRIIDDLLAIQHPTGGFPEQFRGSAGSHLQVPASNEAYGTTETPLLQNNGDPVTDQLYVSGFLLFGLDEAAPVLDDPRVIPAADKLAAYLCRIQNRSSRFPHLSGTWFRAFDFQRWEAWASSADAGWGAWSIEAGWAQAWTTATLGLRLQNKTFWDFTAMPSLRKQAPKIRKEFLPAAAEPEPSPPTQPTGARSGN